MLGYQITKEHVWVGAMPDRPGALADTLHELSESGLDLELISVQREMPGRSMLFISPLRTQHEIDVAEGAGIVGDSVRVIRVQGPNAKGLGARIAGALAEARLNIRGYTAAAFGSLHVTVVVFDHDEDVDAAKRVLERVLADS